MFIGLLSSCKISSFSRSLLSNYKEPTIKLKQQPSQARPTLVNINFKQHPFFMDLLSVLISVDGVVTLLMIHIPEFEFQIE